MNLHAIPREMLMKLKPDLDRATPAKSERSPIADGARVSTVPLRPANDPAAVIEIVVRINESTALAHSLTASRSE